MRDISPNNGLIYWLMLGVILPWSCACLCGGGKKNEDIKEVEQLLATSERNGRTVEVTYRRTNRQHKNPLGPGTPFKDRAYVVTEAIWLKSSPPKTSRLTLKLTSNTEGKLLMPDPKVALELSPTADRLAYKIDEGPWTILFLLHPDQWLHGSPDLSSNTPPDWAKIPTLPGYAKQLFLTHSSVSNDLTFSTAHGPIILEHIRHTQGEENLVRFILDIEEEVDGPSTHTLKEAIQKLSPEGREALSAALLEKTLAHTPLNTRALNTLLAHTPASSPLLAPHLLDFATHYAHQPMNRPSDYSTTGAAHLFFEAARQDIDATQPLMETLLGETRRDLSRPGQEGYVMRIVALTILAMAGKPTPLIPTMISERPCQHGYFDEQGELLSKEAATAIVKEEFERGPTELAYHRPKRDGAFVLGALYMTGQPIPESLRTHTCPKTP